MGFLNVFTIGCGNMFRGIVYMAIVGWGWTIYGMVMGWAPKRKIDVPIMLFYSALAAIVVCLSLGLLTGLPKDVPTLPHCITFASLFICGILNFFQLFLMSKAMERGPNGIIWSLIQSAFVCPFVFGVVCFQARCVVWNVVGVLLIIGALVLYNIGKSNNATGKWKLLTFIAMMVTGCTQILCNLPSYFPEAEGVSSIWRTTYFSLGLGSGTIIETLVEQGKKLPSVIKDSIFSLDMWICIVILQATEILTSTFLMYPGMNSLAVAGVGAIAYPITVASSIVSFDMYSLVLLREKRTPLQILGMIMILAGIAGLCL